MRGTASAGAQRLERGEPLARGCPRAASLAGRPASSTPNRHSESPPPASAALRRIVSWNGSGRPLGPERDGLTVEDQPLLGQRAERRDQLGHGGGDDVEPPRGTRAPRSPLLVELDPEAVELVPSERRAAEAGERPGRVVRGLRQHRQNGPEQRQPEPGERRRRRPSAASATAPRSPAQQLRRPHLLRRAAWLTSARAFDDERIERALAWSRRPRARPRKPCSSAVAASREQRAVRVRAADASPTAAARGRDLGEPASRFPPT